MEPMVFIIGGGVVLLAILATLFYAKAKTGSQLTVLEEQLRQKEMQLKEQLSFRALLQTEKEQLLARVSKTKHN
jgi:DNA recombination protein RmuC